MSGLVTRRVIPSAVIALSTVSWPARGRAALERARGGRGRLELFFSFDDPCSAVAVPELAVACAARPVDLVLLPVAERGIPGDPAVSDKRREALVDARRRARRAGREMLRAEPLEPGDTAFLAHWAAAAPQGQGLEAFCLRALAALWFETAGPVREADYAAIWRAELHGQPAPGEAAGRRPEALMRRRGPYDVPAAVAGGRWFFAHDRPAQITDWLDELGWGVMA